MGYAAISFDELKEGASSIADIDVSRLTPHEAMQVMEYKRQIMGQLRMIWAISRQLKLEKPVAAPRLASFLSH